MTHLNPNQHDATSLAEFCQKNEFTNHPEADNEAVSGALSEYLTPEDFIREFPNLFSLSELSWLIKTRKQNCFPVCQVSPRKILLCKKNVLAWLEGRS